MKTEFEEYLEKSHFFETRVIKRFCSCFPDTLYNDLRQPFPVSMMELDSLIKKFEVMFEWKIAVIHGYLPFGECLHLAYSRKFRNWLRRLKPGIIVTSFAGVQVTIKEPPFVKDGKWKVMVRKGICPDTEWEYSLYDINPSIPIIKPERHI